MRCSIVPFLPGRRPTDEDRRPGFGSSDCAAFVTDGSRPNRAVLLFDIEGLPDAARLEATVTVDGTPLPGWEHRRIERRPTRRQRVGLRPDVDFAGVDFGLTAGFLRRVRVEVRAVDGGSEVQRRGVARRVRRAATWARSTSGSSTGSWRRTPPGKRRLPA